MVSVVVTVVLGSLWPAVHSAVHSGTTFSHSGSDCECAHRGRVTVTATAYTVRQCDIVTVPQCQCDHDSVHSDSVIMSVYTATM